MKRTTMRAVGVSVAAAIALGIAGPVANASTATPVPSAVSVVSVPVDTHPASAPAPAASDVTPESIKAIWNAIKKAGLAKKAWEAAKKGRAAFMKWVDNLSSFNPVKWMIKALPTAAIDALIRYILSQY
ncbi:hypothetical protein [Streptomyces sp. NPDC058953]|uniref:hypothetical protein n=1 Tax=unclassified Streptomyces TaxID=2593676 RepID=UPI0036C1AE40